MKIHVKNKAGQKLLTLEVTDDCVLDIDDHVVGGAVVTVTVPNGSGVGIRGGFGA